MILKTTLCNSNPCVIRIFYIEDNRTVEELMKTIAILHGWNMDVSLNLVQGDTHADGNVILSEIFNPDILYEDWYAQMPMQKPRYYYYSSITEQKWRFRIQLLEEKEKHDQVCLIRYRGPHPNSKATSVRENNEWMDHMLWYGSAPGSMTDEMDAQCQKVDLEAINKRLMKKIVLKQEEFRIDERYAMPLEHLLDYIKVDQLKEIIRENGLKISTNQRKKHLIEDLKSVYCNDEFWMQLLDEMDMEEYECFKNICFGRKNPETHPAFLFHTLITYGLLLSNYDSECVIPLELLHFYGKYMEEYGDEQLIYRKKLNQIMRIANKLYGIYTKKMCKKLASILYPDDVNPEDFSKVWHKGPNRKLFNAFVMYNTQDLEDDRVFELIRGVEIDADGMYYVPAKEELMDISKNGMNYPETERKVLENILHSFQKRYLYGDEQIAMIVKMIYHFCHVEYKREWMEEFLFKDLDLRGTKGQKKRLLDTIEKLRGKVRTIEFRGFNPDEMRVRNTGR